MNRAGLLQELTRHLDRQITRARRARLNLSVLTLVNDVPGHPPGPRARGFCRVQRHRYRLPPGDDPGVRPRLRVVLDKRKPTAQFDGGGELAAPLKCGADRRGILIVDGKHRQSMHHNRQASHYITPNLRPKRPGRTQGEDRTRVLAARGRGEGQA